MDTQATPQNKAWVGLFLPGLILGILIGVLVGFWYPKKTSQTAGGQQNAQQNTAQKGSAQGNGPTTPPPGQQSEPAVFQGFYGKVLEIKGSALTVQEVLPPGSPTDTAKAAKTYTVAVKDETSYTYQKPRDPKVTTGELFTPQPGALKDVKKDFFVYIETPDDVKTKTDVTAKGMIYSDKSPFSQ